MRKITTLLFLAMASVVFGQTLPVDFEVAEDEFTDAGSVFNIVDGSMNAPPTNSPMIGEIIGGGGQFDNIQLPMATYIDVTNTSNNTITFDIFTPDTDVMTGLLQLTDRLNPQDGENVPVEIGFTTNGQVGWETITLDFDNAGNGFPFCGGCPQDKPVVLDQFGKIVFFTDFNAFSQDTYYIDNIAGAQNGGATAQDPIPNGPAPIPTATDAQVVFNIYNDSNGYSNNMTYDYCFGALDGEPNLDNAGTNVAQKYNFGAGGFGCGQNVSSDVSATEFVYFDYWASTNTTAFKIFLISDSGSGTVETTYEVGVDEAIVQETWTTVEVPISNFTGQGFDVANYLQYKFDVTAIEAGSIVYIDNIYLTNAEVLGSDEFNVNTVSIYPNPSSSSWNISANEDIKNVSVYNALGKEVLNINGENRTLNIDGSTLATGLYFAKVSTAVGISSLKLVKQ